MSSSWVHVGVKGFQDFEKAAKNLAEAERDIPNWISRDVDAEAQKVRGMAAQKIMSEATHGKKQTGLRASIAQGIQVVPFEDSTGKGVKVITTVPHADEAPIPAGLNNTMRGWKHPVFGRKTKWVTQHGNIAWFSDSTQQAQPNLTKAIQEDLDRAAKNIG